MFINQVKKKMNEGHIRKSTLEKSKINPVYFL